MNRGSDGMKKSILPPKKPQQLESDAIFRVCVLCVYSTTIKQRRIKQKRESNIVVGKSTVLFWGRVETSFLEYYQKKIKKKSKVENN